MTDLERWAAQDLLPDITPTHPRLDLKTWAEEFRDVYRISEALCRTPFVPPAMLGKQADVAAAIMKGRELGLDPFDALDNIYVVHGRVGYYADFQRRRIIQAGHTFKIVESTDSRCIVEGTRKDTGGTHRAQFTADAARRAGIDLGKYPADKLIARATSRLCKQAFPDVLSGTLIAEDLIDGVIPAAADEQPAQALTEPAPVQRKRKTQPAKAARTQPKPAAKPAADDDEIAELLGDTPQTAGAAPADAPTHGEPETGLLVDPPVTAAPAQTPGLDEPITRLQNRKLHALMRELGITTQTDRHALRDYILGYHPETGLTKSEASKIFDTIEYWRTGSRTIDYPIEYRINDILNTAAIKQAEQEQDNTDES